MDIRHCAQLLREHDKYLLVTHRRPDGDTLGSAAGLCHALRRLGKTAHLYHNPDITENYMTYVAPYLAPEGYEYDTVICAVRAVLWKRRPVPTPLPAPMPE